MCVQINEKLEDLPRTEEEIPNLGSVPASAATKAEAETLLDLTKEDYRAEFTRRINAYKNKEVKMAEINSSDFFSKAFYDSFLAGMLWEAGLEGGDSPMPEILDVHYDWLMKVSLQEWFYYKDFLDDVRYNRVGKNGKMGIEQRIELYVQGLDAIFDAGRMAAMAGFPRTLVRWVLDETFESCESCIYLGGISPLTPDHLPVVPRDGQTLCRQNCKCVVEFYKTNGAKYKQVLETQPSREEIIATLVALKEGK